LETYSTSIFLYLWWYC